MAEIPPTTHIDHSGREFTIRTAQRDDAGAALAYIRSVAGETKNFVIEPDEFPATVEEERDWIQDHLEHPGKLLLLAEADERIIGSVSFEAGPFRRIAHRGTLGIAVVEEWRGRGVGTTLLQAVVRWAEAAPNIEKICLEVFATNERGSRLYRKLGFVEEGRRIRDIRRGPDDYVDAIAMALFVK